jgi:hypothetical protein
MDKLPYLPFRIVLGLVALAHIFIGGLACMPGMPLVRLAAVFYSATITLTPQLVHVMQMFGAYMLTVGALAVFAMVEPVRNRAIANGVIILLVLRILQRAVFAKYAWTVFKIPAGAYWMQTVLFTVTALALLLLRPKKAD